MYKVLRNELFEVVVFILFMISNPFVKYYTFPEVVGVIMACGIEYNFVPGTMAMANNPTNLDILRSY